MGTSKFAHGHPLETERQRQQPVEPPKAVSLVQKRDLRCTFRRAKQQKRGDILECWLQLTLVESRVSSESRWVVGGADSLTRPHPQSLQSALRWMDAANRCNTVKNRVDGAEDISGARRRTCDLTRARTHKCATHDTCVDSVGVVCRSFSFLTFESHPLKLTRPRVASGFIPTHIDN